MKVTKYLNQALFTIMGTFGLVGTIVAVSIFAYTSVNVEKLELLTRAVRDDAVEQLQSKRADIVVELGDNYSAAVINGELYTWGFNDVGQLGLGDRNRRDTPTQVTSTANGEILPGTVTQISLGWAHSTAVIDGALYTWGYNYSGQLGLGDTNNRTIPTQVTSTVNGSISARTVTQISLGRYHSAAVINGSLYTWGNNDYGELGLGNTNRRTIPTQVTSTASGSIPTRTVTQIALGEHHSAAIIDGSLYTWGWNAYDQLGLGNFNGGTNKHTPTQVTSTANGSIPTRTVTQIALGYNYSAAIIDGALYTWGYNGSGQLGLGDTNQRNIPTQVTSTASGTIISGTVAQISLGRDHSATVINGALYTWGYNYYGQLGLGNSGNGTHRNIPTQVTSTASGTIIPRTVTQIALGYNYSAAVINGALYTWGRNDYGQLGLGDYGSGTYRKIPTHVTQIEIIQKDTITLNPSIDLANIRDKIVYNVTTNDILKILNQNPFIIPGLSPSSTISNISFKSKTGTTSIGGNNVGKIIVTYTVDSKKFETTFNGFRPVNQTQNITIAQKSLPVNEALFANDEINQLVADANADTTGRNNKLATWIINNSSLIIGNTANEYTQDFPRNARITKVSDVRVVNGRTGTLSFKIHVDKYYKPSTPVTNLVESTSTDANITLTNPISLSGFRTNTQSNPTVITTSNRDISSESLKQLFGYVNNTANITGNGLVKLNEYIDLSSFPLNTNFKIIDPQSNGTTELSFQINASKYFDANGILQNSSRTFARLTINNLKNVKSMLVQNTSYDKLTPYEILKYIGYDSANPTASLNSTKLFDYVTASNPFPSNTQFRLASSPIISTDNTKLTLNIQANTWFNFDGSIQTTNKTYGPFIFSKLIPIIDTNIKVKDNYDTDISSSNLVKNFGWNNMTGTYNNAVVDLYVNFSTGAHGASYTMENLGNRNGEVFFTIVADRSYVNGIVTVGTFKYNLTITGLKLLNDSLSTTFLKNEILGDGNTISNLIITNIQVGTMIGYNNPIWNHLVNTNIYPPNTIFTITNITTNDKAIFKTFSISFIASNYYDNDTIMNVPAPIRTININNLKFIPTSFTINNKLPSIDANQFLEYINYNESAGSFDAMKLQEFVTLTGFDLTRPGTSTRLINPSPIVDNKIKFGLEVLCYVDNSGIGVNGVNTYSISLELNVLASPDSLKNQDFMSVILAASISGSAILVLFIIFILIRMKKNKNKDSYKVVDDSFDGMEYW